MKLLWIAGAAVIAVTVASLAPGPYSGVRQVPGSGGPLFRSAQFDPAASATLQRACGNCHSNQTEWPWYSRLAPVSWVLRKDVSEGRKFLNFSQWQEYGSAGQSQLLSLAEGQIKDGTMPPKRYLLLHPEAKLSEADRFHLIAALRLETARVSPLIPNR